MRCKQVPPERPTAEVPSEIETLPSLVGGGCGSEIVLTAVAKVAYCPCVDLAVDQAELFPNIAAHAPKRSKFAQVMGAIEQHGPLLSQVMASYVMGVSRQRVHELVHNGKLASVEVANQLLVPVAAIEFWLAEEEDKGGRPKAVTLTGMWKHAFKERRDAKERIAAQGKK